MKTGDLVEIIWEDHCSSGPGWQEKEKIYSPALCRTVGWIAYQDKKVVTLTSNLDTGNTDVVGGYHTRLRRDIVKSKVLKGI